MISLNNITKSYTVGNHSLEVLKGINLEIGPGELVSIMGSSGSGKSTLMKIIFGVVDAENKFIRIDGKVKNKVSQLMNEVSYLPQENFIPNNLTVIKAINLSVDKFEREQFINDDMISSFLNNILKAFKSTIF